jgi:hypothetical protein
MGFKFMYTTISRPRTQHFIFFSDQDMLSPQSMSVDLNQDKTGQSADPRRVGIQHAETLSVFFFAWKQTALYRRCYALSCDYGYSIWPPTAGK